jgi:hypothetical protein
MTTVEEIKHIQYKNEKLKKKQYISDSPDNDNDFIDDDNFISISGGVGLYGNVRVVQQIWNLLATVVEVYIATGIDSEVLTCDDGNVRMSTCSYPHMSDTDVMPFCMHFHCFVHRFCFVVLL